MLPSLNPMSMKTASGSKFRLPKLTIAFSSNDAKENILIISIWHPAVHCTYWTHALCSLIQFKLLNISKWKRSPRKINNIIIITIDYLTPIPITTVVRSVRKLSQNHFRTKLFELIVLNALNAQDFKLPLVNYLSSSFFSFRFFVGHWFAL